MPATPAGASLSICLVDRPSLPERPVLGMSLRIRLIRGELSLALVTHTTKRGCRRGAEEVPKGRCRRGAEEVPKRCRGGAEGVVLKRCRRGAEEVPRRCRTGGPETCKWWVVLLGPPKAGVCRARLAGPCGTHLLCTSFAPLVHLFRTFSLCPSLVPLSRLLVLFFTRVYRMDGLQVVLGLRVQRRR